MYMAWKNINGKGSPLVTMDFCKPSCVHYFEAEWVRFNWLHYTVVNNHGYLKDDDDDWIDDIIG